MPFNREVHEQEQAKAWCKHTPATPCAYCQDKHDEHEWITTFAQDPHGRWLERKRALDLRAKLADVREALALAVQQGFPCCGGSDEHPPEHTQDCMIREAIAAVDALRKVAP